MLLLLALVAAAVAEGQSHEVRKAPSIPERETHGQYYHGADHDHRLIVNFLSFQDFEEPKYEYSYQVKDYHGNDFGHEETRDGDQTEGSYYNHLPDGRQQKVKYNVNGYSGYVADVTYEGEAHYDSGSYESKSRKVRESSGPSRGSLRSGESSGSRFRFNPRESRTDDTVRFRFGSSGESYTSRQESKESRRHHKAVYYQPIFQSSESASKYDDEDDDDDDFLSSMEYLITTYMSPIRYTPH